MIINKVNKNSDLTKRPERKGYKGFYGCQDRGSKSTYTIVDTSNVT